MVCQVCHRVSTRWVCISCYDEIRPAGDRLLPDGLRLIAAFEHEGPARALSHHLKYRGLTEFADLVARTLAPRLPEVPLVPVPRSVSRRLRYGVDPAREIATRLGAHLGTPVLEVLTAPAHSVRRAGGDHARPAPEYRLRRPPSRPSILVDDVVTTGATLVNAARALGEGRIVLAVAANVVSQVTSLLRPHHGFSPDRR